MEFGKHFPSDKGSECFGGRAYGRYSPEPPVPRSIDIMREYYDWIPMSFFFTGDKVSGA